MISGEWRPLLVLISSLVVAGAARAESPGETRPAQPRKDSPPKRKSPAAAFGLGVGVTAAGAAVILAGRGSETFGSEIFVVGGGAMLVGPSIGRWYGGNKTGIGLAARGVAGAVMLVAMVASDEAGCDEEHSDCPDRPADGGWKPVFYSGAALWVGSSLYDIVRAPLDAREYNREHELTIAPTVVPGGAGLAVGGRF